MITQYTRLWLDNDGLVKHCATQELPFKDEYSPIEDAGAAQYIDMEIDVGAKILAKELIKSVDIVDGTPIAKQNSRIVGNPRKKPVNESAIKAEIEKELKGNAPDLIAEFRKRGRNITKLSGLPVEVLIRTKKLMNENKKS